MLVRFGVIRKIRIGRRRIMMRRRGIKEWGIRSRGSIIVSSRMFRGMFLVVSYRDFC